MKNRVAQISSQDQLYFFKRSRVCHQTRYMREPLAYVVCGDGC
jgi:hypothetical protein